MAKVYFIEDPDAPIGSWVVRIEPTYKGDIHDEIVKAMAQQGLPADTPYQEVEDMPPTIFKNARKIEKGKLVADLTKSKLIAHDIRRIKRSEEFMPLDNDNPNVVVTAETEIQRVIIRDKYTGIQTAFDNVNSVSALKGLMIAQGWTD